MIVFICGETETGKSTLNTAIALALLRQDPRLRMVAVRPEGCEDISTRGSAGRIALFQSHVEALDYIFKHELINLVVSFSEVQDICGYRAEHFDQRMQKVIFRGRHSGVNLIADSQRAAEVKTALLSQAGGRIFSFRQTLEADVKRLEWYGRGASVLDVIPSLPNHVFFSFMHRRIYRLTRRT